MQERVAAEATEAAEPAAIVAAAQGPVVARMLALQRSAGNRAVTQMLAREPASGPSDFVFILGPKDDEALKSAELYYRSPLMTSQNVKVLTRKDMSDPTLEGILEYLSAVKYPIREITIVTHGSGSGVLSFPLNSSDTDEKVTAEELDQAVHDNVLRPLNGGQITESTRIRLQACFTGHGSKMINLLDRAFGDGAGTVIAPNVEVAYANDIWHSEGLSGWYVWSPDELTVDELATALQTKYGKSVKLDLTTYQEDADGHHKGEWMKDDAAMWRELARKATKSVQPGEDGKPVNLYIANAFTQRNRADYESDPLLYSKSVYYSPKEI